jgi:hypothetical protein
LKQRGSHNNGANGLSGCDREKQTLAFPHCENIGNMANEIMLELINVIYNELNIEMKVGGRDE